MSNRDKVILKLSSISFNYPGVDLFSASNYKVLDNVSISVGQAEIYGLLGASGCGKTTLLRLLLGRLKTFSGEIILFDQRIDFKHKPNPLDIGYMPQEIVLYDEFTPIEMLQYFGRLYRMSTESIIEQIDHLFRLLELNKNFNHKKLILQLSGGQRRRVSLAIALLHSPRLLILDEPTVGVDPMLREVIWNHLKYLTNQLRKTVILTTHYIEEARFAQTIGFLRHGRLLVQAEPECLLERFKVNSMEEVFLRLCKENNFWIMNEEKIWQKTKHHNDKDDSNRLSRLLSTELIRSTAILALGPHYNLPEKHLIKDRLNDLTTSKNDQPPPSSVSIHKLAGSKIQPHGMNGKPAHIKTKTNRSPSSKKAATTTTTTTANNHYVCWSHLWTLTQKNFRQVYRNLSLLLFFIFLPAIEIALIMMCIGRDINHIPIAVYNGEKSQADLSEVFLESFEPDAFILHHYDSPEEAIKAVKLNKASAVLQFSERFSQALRSRFFSFGLMDEGASSKEVISIWNDSSVYVQLDMSNQLIGLQIQRQLLTAFLNFAQRLAVSLGLSNHTFKPPISFGPPIYGIQTSAVVETFIAPGALIMIAFFATTIVTCHLLIHEIRLGLIERAAIAGVTTAEFIFSHIITQSAILLVQLCLVFLTAFYLFRMPFLGSLPLSIALICLQGLCGLMYGLMLSATCPDEIYATTLAIGTFFPSVIIGGIFWPVQSMPTMLQYLSQCLPSTQSIDALRFILLRDWNLAHLSVASAFIVSTVWLFVFLICALRNFKKRI